MNLHLFQNRTRQSCIPPEVCGIYPFFLGGGRPFVVEGIAMDNVVGLVLFIDR